MDSISKVKMAASFFFLILLRSSDPYPIKTIVLLVMENRSFDHMIGWMKQINPDIDGVDGTESNRISAADALSRRVPFKRDARFVDADPGHSFQAIREQIFGSNSTSLDPAPMNGFAQNACSLKCSGMPEEVMSGFDPDMVPVYRALVAEFAVFDRWFAACPASTQPNRMFVHSATSSGAVGNVPRLLAEGYPQRTIFDSLDDDGRSFAIYYQNIPATLFFRNMRMIRRLTRFRPYNMFRSDAARGALPEYVVVEQRYLDMKTEPANDDHPSHDVYEGQKLVKELYETLRASPQWNETLMIITYDEHGGFFDHVATPMHGVPSPDGIRSSDPFFFNFDRLGVRVPTIMVSPWIDKGTVVHGPEGRPFPTSQFEHSSIPATVKKIFNLSSSFLTRRDEWAGTFDGVVRKRDRVRTDCPEVLPAPVRLRERVADENAILSEFQREMVQLAAVLNGDHLLAGFPDRGLENMTVKEAKVYTDGALRRFFEAGRLALRMGVDGRRKLQMRPSLTTRLPVESTERP